MLSMMNVQMFSAYDGFANARANGVAMQSQGQGQRPTPGQPNRAAQRGGGQGANYGQFVASRPVSEPSLNGDGPPPDAHDVNQFARIRVIGVGGAGGNAINRM